MELTERDSGQRVRERMEVELPAMEQRRPGAAGQGADGHGASPAMEMRRPWSCYEEDEVLAGATEVPGVASTAVALELSEHGGRSWRWGQGGKKEPGSAATQTSPMLFAGEIFGILSASGGSAD
ncbi:hypothetical protein KSP39_PZI015899 [Platanthera zijinensis]|uniref:Uncharacterized protein n=1 Tax=Platanthera zijinensis TaxID=2320716 RepID=A0AAP0G1Z2_9ASPA